MRENSKINLASVKIGMETFAHCTKSTKQSNHSDHIIALAYPGVSPKKPVAYGYAQVKIANLQEVDFHFNQLLAPVSTITYVQKVADQRWDTLVVLAGDEHGRRPDQLQRVLADELVTQIEVHQLHPQVQRLVVQLEALLDLDHPVNEKGTHPGGQTRLPLHVVFWHEKRLSGL